MRSVDEFWAKVKKGDGPDDCWVWTGAKDGNGYGNVNWQGRVMSAHRVAYVIEKGEIPEKKMIRWSCKNKICVRFSHFTFKNGAEKEKVLKPARRKKTEKTPLVVVDKDSRLLSLIQELTTEADKVDRDRRKALIKCCEARELIDGLLLTLEKLKNETDRTAEKAIALFRDNDFTRLAEEGRVLREEGGREE